MIVHNDPLLRIFFGDARSSVQKDFLMSNPTQEDISKDDTLAQIKKLLQLRELFFLKQEHGTAGIALADVQALSDQQYEGDYLLTQREGTGLGVYTADCLPIIFYDTYHRATGICHAGWVGSVNGIAVCALERMKKEFGTRLDQLRIFFGPSAKVCCYKVDDEFIKQLPAVSYKEHVSISRADGNYFDLPLFNRLQLESHGVKKGAFQLSYNVCTICDPAYCSHRRNSKTMKRQVTVVALK